MVAMSTPASPETIRTWQARAAVVFLGLCFWLVLVGLPSLQEGGATWFPVISGTATLISLFLGISRFPSRARGAEPYLLALVPASVALGSLGVPPAALVSLWVWVGGALVFVLYLSCTAWLLSSAKLPVEVQSRNLEPSEVGRDAPRAHHLQTAFVILATASAAVVAVFVPASLDPNMLEARWGAEHPEVWSLAATLGFCLTCLWLVGLVAPATRRAKYEARPLRTRVLRSASFLLAALFAITLALWR